LFVFALLAQLLHSIMTIVAILSCDIIDYDLGCWWTASFKPRVKSHNITYKTSKNHLQLGLHPRPAGELTTGDRKNSHHSLDRQLTFNAPSLDLDRHFIRSLILHKTRWFFVVENCDEHTTGIIRAFACCMHKLWNFTKKCRYARLNRGGGLRLGLWGEGRPCQEENRPFLGSSIRPNLVLIRPWSALVRWKQTSLSKRSKMSVLSIGSRRSSLSEF